MVFAHRISLGEACQRLEHDSDQVAIGSGKMDIPSAVQAADEKILRWLIVELDVCATDMFSAVENSYRYITDSGLGYGNR